VQTQKKIKETDAIFTKLKAVNKAADEAKSVLRLSWDAKATVKLGDFSRGGKNRLQRKAADHDFKPDGILNPFWDLVAAMGQSHSVFHDFACHERFHRRHAGTVVDEEAKAVSAGRHLGDQPGQRAGDSEPKNSVLETDG